MSGSLNDFLGEDVPAPEPEVVVVPEAVVEPVAEPVVNDKPADEEVLQPGARVPVAALQAERQQRQDWKEKATRYEGELSAIRPQLDELKDLKAQLAELQKARVEPTAPVVQQAPPEAVPNPVEDPQGFIAYQQRQQQQAMWNERLNLSEAMLRDQMGDADVDAKMSVFKKAMAQNPALRDELSRQPHPYKWAYTQAQRMEAMEKVGSDPEAFVQKRIAEERAKWEAEAGVVAQRAPEPVLPQSLAGARNAGARAIVEQAVPEFEDIFRRKPR